MATLTIEGKKVKVDDAFLSLSPEQQAETVDEIAQSIGVQPKSAQTADQTQNPEDSPKVQDFLRGMHQDMEDFTSSNDGVVRNADSFMRGVADTATFGMADEIAGLGQGIVDTFNPYSKDFLDPNISVGLDTSRGITLSGRRIREERAAQAQRDDQDPAASTVGRVAGALTGAVGLTKAGAPLMASLPADASLLAKTAQSAKAGALYSGLYGLGSGTDLKDRAEQGTTAALTGAAIGAAIPGVSSVVAAATKPVRDAVKGYFRPETFANQKIAERLSAAGLDPDQAAAKMARTPGLSLADVGGKTTQNLLKTTTNIPGPAQARVATQLAQKAMQQGDRIRSNIKALFADPDGYLTAKDKIAADAKKLAAPLYKQAYETPVPFTEALEKILQTPAGKAALANASRIAANEQQPFQQFFINMVDDTTGTIRRVPDARGWDYIKRGFDDVIDANKAAGTFGKMNNEGRVISALKDRMLHEIDAANPSYAAARKVWSDQASLDRALQSGQEAMGQSPEATKQAMASMSQAEKEAFKIGVADALRTKIGTAGFTHNALLKFFSSRDQLANLRAAFDNDEQFAAFRTAMFAEARKRSTYNTVTGNSSTAKQMADLMDAGGLQDTVNFAKDTATGGIASATLRFIGSRMKMLGGFTPQVADNIAKKLMTTNPQQAQAITQELSRIEQAAISADQKRQLVYKLITPALSDQAQTTGAQ